MVDRLVENHFLTIKELHCAKGIITKNTDLYVFTVKNQYQADVFRLVRVENFMPDASTAHIAPNNSHLEPIETVKDGLTVIVVMRKSANS